MLFRSVAVTGTAGVSKLALGPGARPPLAVDAVEVAGVEVDWPERVRVARVAIRKPAALLEREKDGSFPLRTMLMPQASKSPSTASAVPSAPAVPAVPPKRLALEIGNLTIVDGNARFVDRTTTPFYSEEISKLAIAVRDRKSTRLNSSHIQKSRMPSSA